MFAKAGHIGFSRTRVKIVSGMANRVDPDQTVCIYHFVINLGVHNFMTFTLLS